MARAFPGARSCRARPGISEFPIGLCEVGGLTACWLLDSSVDLHDVRDCLGHANITTTSRYLRSTPVRLAQALDRMEASAETVVDVDDSPHHAAMRWYRLAADQGYAVGQYNLGSMYDTGRGVAQDYVQARMWFNLSASRSTGEDRENAVSNRDQAASRLTPDALNEAQRLAREWEAAQPR